MVKDISVISSRNRVPDEANFNQAFLSVIAPVKAPFS